MSASQDKAVRKELTRSVEREDKVEKRRGRRWHWKRYKSYKTVDDVPFADVEAEMLALHNTYGAELTEQFRSFVAEHRIETDLRAAKLKLYGSFMWCGSENWGRWMYAVSQPLLFKVVNGRLIVELAGVAEHSKISMAGVIGDTLFFTVDYSDYCDALIEARRELQTFTVENCIESVQRYSTSYRVPTPIEAREALDEVDKAITKYQLLIADLCSRNSFKAHYALSASDPVCLESLTTSRFNKLLTKMQTFDSDDEDGEPDAKGAKWSCYLSHHRPGELDGSARAATKLERRAIFRAESEFGSTVHSSRVKARDRSRKQNRDAKHQF